VDLLVTTFRKLLPGGCAKTLLVVMSTALLVVMSTVWLFQQFLSPGTVTSV
jgi:hypothetical protein